ncbi:MAG TPA: hypothetical protein VFI99_10285 [Nocardioides sp.]|nr:hypothetical protein [Nocardioides sp.]
MTNDDETTPGPQNADDWLVSGTPETESAAERPTGRGERLRAFAKPLALVAAGLILGIGAVSAAQAVGGDDSDRTEAGAGAFDPSGDTDGGGFDDHGLPPGFGGGPFPGGTGSGLAGEQHLTGTLTAFGDSTVTVRSSSGTATYQVDSDTQIVRNGAAAQLSELQAGDPVLVHVYPASSDRDGMVVERIFAGTLPSSPGLDPDGDDDDGGDGWADQPSTTL